MKKTILGILFVINSILVFSQEQSILFNTTTLDIYDADTFSIYLKVSNYGQMYPANLSTSCFTYFVRNPNFVPSVAYKRNGGSLSAYRTSFGWEPALPYHVYDPADLTYNHLNFYPYFGGYSGIKTTLTANYPIYKTTIYTAAAHQVGGQSWTGVVYDSDQTGPINFIVDNQAPDIYIMGSMCTANAYYSGALQPLSNGYHLPISNVVDPLSGLKSLRCLRPDGGIVNYTSTTVMNLSGEYIIAAEDNVGNVMYIKAIVDLNPPVATFGTPLYSRESGTPGSQYDITIPLTVTDALSSINTTDNKIGIALYQNSQQIISYSSGSIIKDSNGNITGIQLRYLTPGNSYELRLTLEDTFIYPNSVTRSYAFRMPILPVIDTAVNSIQWANPEKTSATVQASLNVSGGESEWIDWAQIRDNDGSDIIYTFSTSQINSIKALMTGVAGLHPYGFSFNVPENLLSIHQPTAFRFIRRSHGVYFTQVFTLNDAIENRTPAYSDTDSIQLLNNGSVFLTIDNSDDLYGQEWIYTGTGGLVDFIRNKEADPDSGIDTIYLPSIGTISTAGFTDADGDAISLQTISDSGNVYLVLREYGDGIDNYYLLPYRLKPDSEDPQFTDITIENGSGEAYPKIETSGTSYCLLPPLVSISGISDLTGIGSVTFAFTDNEGTVYEATDSAPAIESGLYAQDWAALAGFQVAEGLTVSGTLVITLYDLAGNSTSASRSIVVDRQAPDAVYVGDTPMIMVSGIAAGAELTYDCDVSQSRIILQFDLDYYDVSDPTGPYIFEMQSSIGVAVFDSGTGQIQIDFSSAAFAPNDIAQLNLTIKDLAGNGTDQNLEFALPASISIDDILVGKTNEPDPDLPYSEWNGISGHHFEFSSAAGSGSGWTSAVIERFNVAVGIWEDAVVLDNGGTAVADTGLQPHGTYQYRYCPVNASGFRMEGVNEDQYTLANYSPGIVADFFVLPGNGETRYFGPDTRIGSGAEIPVTFSDPDGDTVSTEIVIRDIDSGEEHASDYDPDSFSYIYSLAYDLGLAPADGETCGIGFTAVDTWDEADNPTIVESEMSTLVYDSSAPQYQEESTDWLNASGTAWGYTGVGINITDAGCGIDQVIMERQDDGTGEWIEIPADIPALAVNGFYSGYYTFPQGEYQVRLRLSDLLGNESESTVLGIVRCDTVPPQFDSSSIIILDSGNSFDMDGTLVFNNPIVKVTIADFTEDGELAEISFQYRNGGQPVSTGTRQVANQSEMQIITCMPDQSKIAENTGYSLWIKLTDKGGNSSDWVEADTTVAFDLGSPQLELVSWALDYDQTLQTYISASATAALPQIAASDSISAVEDIDISYRLLSESGDWIADADDANVSFPVDGKYQLSVIATDEAGLESELRIPVIFDGSAPAVPVVYWLPTLPGYCYPGQSLSFAVASADSLSGVNGYSIALSDSEGPLGTVQLSRIEADGYTLVLPADIRGDTLTVLFFSFDRAGNSSSATVALPVSAPAYDISFDVPFYLGAGQPLHAEWSYCGSEQVNYYHVSVIGSRTFWQGDVQEPGISVPAAELSEVNHGETLVIAVNAVTDSGLVLPVYYSHAIAVDYNKPEIADFSAPTVATPETISASWNFNDESPVGTVNLYADKVSDNGETITIMPLGLATLDGVSTTGGINAASLFPAGTFDGAAYIRLRLEVSDKAFNISEAVTGTITIDSTEAPVFLVIDQGDYINPASNDLFFQWNWAAADPESGPGQYRYQLCVNGDINPDGWTPTAVNEVTIAGSEVQSIFGNGSEVYLAVQRETVTGKKMVVFSNGIILDDSAPEIVAVGILNGSQEPYDDVFYTLGDGEDENVKLQITGYDEDSGIIGVKAQAGAFTESGFSATGTQAESNADLVEVSLPVVPFGTVVQFEAICYNGVELASLPSYSRGIMFTPEQAVIANVVLTETDGGFSGSWAVSSQAPLTSQEVKLYRNGSEVLFDSQVTVGVADRNASFTLPNPDDGNYTLLVTAQDATGQPLGGVSATSLPLLVDHTAPQSPNLAVSPYIHNQLDYSVQTDEAVNQLRVRILAGPKQIYEDSIIFTGGPSGLTVWNPDDIDLSSQPVWQQLLAEGSRTLTVLVNARDLQGNWSDAAAADLVFDATVPTQPVLARDNTLNWGEGTVVPDPALTGYGQKITGLELTATDDVSPIVSYRFGLTGATPEEPEEWSDYIAVDDPSAAVSLSDLVLRGVSLADGKEFHVAVQVANQAGLVSDTGYSELLKADLSAPEFELAQTGCFEIQDNGEDPPVGFFNAGGAGLDVQITSDASRYLEYSFQIVSPSGSVAESGEGLIDTDSGDSLSLSVLTDIEAGGVYSATFTLTDLFGRNTAKTVYYSLNSPPTLQIPAEFHVRPEEELRISFDDWIKFMTDSQGIAEITIDCPELSESTTLVPGGDDFVFKKDQKLPGMQSSEYLLTLTSADGQSATASADFSIIVENSNEGVLQTDEYWSGTHIITGEVIVPSDTTLTIAPGTQILAAAGAEYGTGQRIIVETGGTLVHENDGPVTYGLLNPEPGLFWQGILVNSDTAFENVTISGADRAIVAAAGTTVTISNCNFLGNRIGVHVLSNAVNISASHFTDNIHYGVKEEQDGLTGTGTDPLMTGNLFSGNGFDYYDYTLSVIDIATLNTLPGNAENGAE